jgi:hypothetical protein
MGESIDKIVSNITDLFITPIIYLLVSLAVMYFFWGLTIFILNADDLKQRTEGKNHMIWGIIGLFIIYSVWGIINFVDATVNSVV